jgi:hypothetical protein
VYIVVGCYGCGAFLSCSGHVAAASEGSDVLGECLSGWIRIGESRCEGDEEHEVGKWEVHDGCQRVRVGLTLLME